MALAGWDTQQSMDALPGVLNLAAASGMDLANASDAVTDILSAFGMQASDAGMAADQFAYAQANANTSADQLTEAMSNCGVNANGFGQDLTQTNAVLMALSNEMLKGAPAGTALSAVFRDMGNAMKDGCIQIGKTKVQITDSKGNFLDMTEIIKGVEKATNGMSESERQAALSSTFTADSIKAMGILLNEGSDKVAGYADQLENCSGTAEKMAETMNDNLNGQITALKSALEGAAIAIGEALLPMMKGLVSALQGALDWFNGLSDGMKTTIVTIGLIAASIGPLLLILGSLASAIGNLIELKALLAESSILSSAIGRVSGLFTSLRNVIMGSVVPAIQSLWAFMLTNPITFVIAAIAALVAGFVYLWNNCESFRNFWINLWDNIVETVSKIPGEVQKIFEKIQKFFSELPDKISKGLDSVGDKIIDWGYSISGGVGDTMVDLYGVFKDSFEGIADYVENVTTLIKDIFTGNWGSLGSDIEKIFSGISDSVGNILQDLVNIVGDVFGMINDAIQSGLKAIWSPIIDWACNFNTNLGQAFLEGYYAITDTFDMITIFIRDIMTVLGDILTGNWQGAWEHLQALWNDMCTYAEMIFNDIKNSVVNAFLGMKDLAVDALSNIGQWFNELPGKIGTALGTALGTIASWIVNTWNYFTTNIPKWIESIGQWFSELPGKIGTWLTNTYNNVISWGSNMLSKAIETGTNFVNNVVNFIKNLPTTVYNWLTQTYNKVVSWATQMGNKARETGSTFVSKVGSTIQSLPGQVWSYLSQTISKASTFVSQFGQKATQAARSFTTNIVNGVRGIPNQMLSIGRSIVQGIWNGISGMGSWLRGQISSFASSVVAGFKAGFKINSPSKIMRDVIGKGIVEGIGVGIDQEEDSLLTKAYKLAGNVVNVMDGNIATANLFDSAKNLTTSMDIATSQATGQDKINKFDSLLHVENLTINDDKDVETLANDIAFYLKRKNILTV